MDEAKDNSLLAEIMAEKASAYFATVRRMQAALQALAANDGIATPESLHNPEHQRLRNQLLAEAAEQAWFFIIQREALRLPYYEELFADFGIPGEVRKNMGPKRQPAA